MSKKMWLLLASVAVVAFVAGYGTTAKAWHANWYGYFYHTYDTSGLEVLPPWGGPSGCQGDGWALPGWVNTPSEFINFTVCKLGGNTQSRRGAAFIISTMIGQNSVSPSSAQINEFAARVNYASSQGWINFGASVGCVLPNTYYQDSGNGDVAKYSGCGSGPGNAIVFSTPNGQYIIKRFCANPLGGMPPLPDDINFNMSGSSSVNDTTVLPNQVITFSHNLRNNGPTSTSPYAIGWNTETGPSASGPWSYGGVSGSSGPFGGVYGENVGSQNYTVPANAVPMSQICYRLYWSPDNHNGGYEWSAPACATVQYNFTLQPNVTPTITTADGVAVTGNYAEPGDSITFTYSMRNMGTTISQNATCTYRMANYAGYSTTPPVTTYTPAGPPAANCAPSRTFPVGNTSPIATEVIPAAAANTSYCRQIVVSPATFGGPASSPVNACVHVATKPYARVYGGDVSAGGGLVSSPNSTSCNLNGFAAVVGWNRRGTGSGGWSGAGVQFATYAMHQIFDMSTGLGSGSGPPQTVSFANTGISPTVSTANGRFGGMFGSAACIPDHYATMPSPQPPVLTSPITDLSGLGSGSYSATGNVRITAGSVSPGEEITLYVSGNLYIDGPLTYGGNGTWTSGNIPMLRVIVSGNIFIDDEVTQLDGLYVAQQTAPNTNGVIYTCTAYSIPPGPYAQLPLNGVLASVCNRKLVVNGSFVARRIMMMRTSGTLRSANAAETPATGNMAEAFIYNPALWMSQPSDDTGAAVYDAISSLPPIL